MKYQYLNVGSIVAGILILVFPELVAVAIAAVLIVVGIHGLVKG
ncbi:MAG: DUF3096 domain-containing protein [Puniceicoccaceae bacterium]